MLKITDNIYVQMGTRSCNVGIIATKEGLVMIDSPMAPEEAANLRYELAKLGTLRYMINTEPHPDHISGNYYFEGVVIGHEKSRELICSTSIDQIKGMLKQNNPNTILDANYHLCPPTITFSQNLTLNLGDHTLKLMSLPGHTPCEIAVYIPEEKVVFSGDNVVNGISPFLHESDPYGWLESLSKLEQLDIKYIVPGHGAVCDKSYLPHMKHNINIWLDAVQKSINQGMTMEETQKNLKFSEPLPGDKQMLAFMQTMNVPNLYKILKSRPKI